MTVFLKLDKKITIYRLITVSQYIAIYCNILNRNPCIVICIVSPDSCQYTALSADTQSPGIAIGIRTEIVGSVHP